MKYQQKSVFFIFILFIPLSAILAQREVSYRVVMDDQQVPKEVRLAFKAMYPDIFMSIWYTSHITYWYEDYAPVCYGSWYPVRQTVLHKFENLHITRWIFR